MGTEKLKADLSILCSALNNQKNEMLLSELGVPLGGQNKRGCCTGWRCKLDIDEHIGGIESPMILQYHLGNECR